MPPGPALNESPWIALVTLLAWTIPRLKFTNAVESVVRPPGDHHFGKIGRSMCQQTVHQNELQKNENFQSFPFKNVKRYKKKIVRVIRFV